MIVRGWVWAFHLPRVLSDSLERQSARLLSPFCAHHAVYSLQSRTHAVSSRWERVQKLERAFFLSTAGQGLRQGEEQSAVSARAYYNTLNAV